MNKTFTTPQGLQLEQLGTFAEYINNRQFRFVITREHPSLPIQVTHRISGARVCPISHLQQAACLGDIVGAAKLALKHLIDAKGADSVYDVISRAEKTAEQTQGA